MTDPLRNELEAASSTNQRRDILCGLALIGLAVFLGFRGAQGAGAWYWIGAVTLGIAGTVWAMASGMKSAPCPACGNRHWIITQGEYEKCSQCAAYLQGDEQAIWLVDENHQAETPVFELELGESFYLPPCCSACGAEATRSVEVEFNTSQTGRNIALAAAGLAAGALVVRTGGGSSGSLSVPHCDEHDDGATFKKENLLLVRSHAFLRGFQELNTDKAAA